MKNILKEGTKEPPKKKIYVMKCKGYGCKYTYSKNDTAYSYYHNGYYVNCSQCNNMNFYLFKRKYREKRKK